MARKAGRYRAQLLLQSADRATLHAILRELRPALEQDTAARKVRWSIDVDPIELFCSSFSRRGIRAIQAVLSG